MLWRRSGQPGCFSFSRRGGWYCLRQPCALRGGCSFCGSLMDNATSPRSCCHCPRRRLYVLLYHQNLPPASEKHQPDVFLCYGYRFSCDPHFLFEKKKQKQVRPNLERTHERTVRTNDDLPLGSKGDQQRFGTVCGCRFRLFELYQYLKRL